MGWGLWRSARMVVAAAPGVVVARVRDEGTDPSCRLGQHLGGGAAARALGGVATAPVASSGTWIRSATRKGARGLRRRALVALADDGGVGRDRVVVAPGSVPFSEEDTDVGVRTSYLPVDTVYVQVILEPT